jgi:glyoxylase-like metal-dependent hydrolase (beta-lactamase superfamily II)
MRCQRFAAALLFVAMPLAAWAQNPDDVEIRTIEVSPGIYMLMGAGGNMGLSVGADGAFLIDDQFAPLNAKITAAVAAVSDSEVRFVINTHWHGDHTGGNEPFGAAGALIVAHENVRRRMDPATFTDVMGNTTQAAPVALPVVTFTDDVSFWWNGEQIAAHHVAPAHTDGDSIVWFRKADVVHMGDNFFVGSLPYIDLDSGGDLAGMIAAAEYVLAQATETTKIIPGHGALAGTAQLRDFHAMLTTIRDRVQGHIDAGRSLDEILAADPVAGYEQFANNWMTVERFVGIVYNSLAR